MLRSTVVLASVLSIGAVAFTGLTLVPDTVQAQEEEKEKPRKLSPKVQRALKAAQDAMQKEDWDTARAKVAEAQAVEKRTEFDDFQINEFVAVLAVRGDDLAGAAKAIEDMLASDFMTPEQEVERLGHVARIYSRLENYPRALEYAQRWQEASGGTNVDAQLIIADSHYRQDNYDGAIVGMEKAIQIADSKGEPVKEPWLQILLHSYAQKGDEAKVEATLVQLVQLAPSKEYWSQLMQTVNARGEADDRVTLHTYRLMHELGVLPSADDYVEMAELANEQGFPGEALKALEDGFANGKLNESRDVARVKARQAEFRKLAAGDRKQVALDEQEAIKAKTGEADVAVGIAYLSYDQYDQAVAALQRGIGKGGLKRPDEAQIMLGRALLRLNRNDEAAKAFAAVPQTSKLARIAQLWAIYATQKNAAAPA